MNAAQKDYVKQEALKANPLGAPILLCTLQLESGFQMMIDGNNDTIKFAIDGRWHKMTYKQLKKLVKR